MYVATKCIRPLSRPAGNRLCDRAHCPDPSVTPDAVAIDAARCILLLGKVIGHR